MKLPKPNYELAQRIYHKMLDPNHEKPVPGIIIGITFRESGIIYTVAWGDRDCTDHYQMELTDTPLPQFD